MVNSELSKKVVEIIEDDEPLLEVLCERFNEEGITTIAAMSGKEGLELAFKNKPDLILLDLLMPKMDGLAVLKKLRKDEWGKTAKVVILTNLGVDDEMMKAASEYQPAYYLVKADWKLDEVIERIKSSLEK